MQLVVVVAFALVGGASSFHLTSRSRGVARLSLQASAETELGTLQTTLFETVNAELGLKLTDFTDVYQAKTWKEGDYSGACEWYDEAKGSKLTGVSKNTVIGPGGYFTKSLNVWMGPGYLVPHMMLTVGEDPASQGGVFVVADFVPRGQFWLGGDQSYLEQYYSNKEVMDWYDGAMKLPNVTPLAPPASVSARLLRSPMCLAVGGLTTSDASTVATAHVQRWLAWLKDAKTVEARQRGAINARDDKQRQFFYRAAVTDSVAKIGAKMGPVVGACSTGPVAEAYVGGGS